MLAPLHAALLARATATNSSSSSAAATSPVVSQGGVLEHVNPVTWNPSNPIVLFIVQACIIIIFCRLLHYPLSYLGQPRVIAEVIGGILLGPSVLMRVHGFKQSIFPVDSMPVISNVANLGLILFLFLIGLEVDLRMFTSNWRMALGVGLAGMALPFGLGCAIAYGIFNTFHTPADESRNMSFGVYALFVGTALAITAFPVLCRILSELELLGSPVGTIVLAAGIGNDITAWVLLALCVALVNNGSGVTALYVLLCCLGWGLFLSLAVRPAFRWLLRKTDSINRGPSQGIVAVTLLLVLFSSWFTSIIGVHPIFGAFLVGLICPHESGFAISLTEKIEDLVSVLLLPLYFALSGLSTNLGLLNDGVTWGYVIGIIACAFAGKIIGGTLAARLCKLLWRESFAIGVLMSCKGLVELIVLNIGLQAGILSQKTFTMFVVMALVTTVVTTPITRALYPPSYQRKLEKWRRGEIDWDEKPLSSESSPSKETAARLDAEAQGIGKILTTLRLDSLPTIFSFVALLGAGAGADESRNAAASNRPGRTTPDPAATIVRPRKRAVEIFGLRLIELTERTSSVMKSTEGDEYTSLDPVVNAFGTFARLHDVAVSGKVAIVPENSSADTIHSHATDQAADLVLVPLTEHGNLPDDINALRYSGASSLPSTSATTLARFAGQQAHMQFVHSAFAKAASATTAVLIGSSRYVTGAGHSALVRSTSGISLSAARSTTLTVTPAGDKTVQILVLFIGGVDDRAALRLALQLARNPAVRLVAAHVIVDSAGAGASSAAKPADASPDATVTVTKENDDGASTLSLEVAKRARVAAGSAGSEDTAADGEPLSAARDTELLAATRAAAGGGRVSIRSIRVGAGADGIARDCIALAQGLVGAQGRSDDLIVVGRRHASLPGFALPDQAPVDVDLQNAIGVLAEKVVLASLPAGVLVVQAARGRW